MVTIKHLRKISPQKYLAIYIWYCIKGIKCAFLFKNLKAYCINRCAKMKGTKVLALSAHYRKKAMESVRQLLRTYKPLSSG